MRLFLLIVLSAATLAGCKSNEEAQRAAAQERQEQLVKMYERIRDGIIVESKHYCAYSMHYDPGSQKFEQCFKDTFEVKKLAVLRDADRIDEENRRLASQLKAQAIINELSSHGSVQCSTYLGATRCDY